MNPLRRRAGRGIFTLLAILTLLAALSPNASARSAGRPMPPPYPPLQVEVFPDPQRLAGEIQAFLAEDARNPPLPQAIVGLGSSSMRAWHATIREDLAPLSLIPRGFGGSTMYDALRFADRIVVPYRPRAVLLYEGDNDIALEVPPEQVLAAFAAFVDTVRAALPDLRIYVISIKPSPSRWEIWPRMQEANRLLQAACAADSRLTYIDVASGMLGEDGRPRPEIFLPDRLHMNEAGYAIWREAVRPVLLERELRREPRPAKTVPPQSPQQGH
jgi:lysophospholipase L1-like esterase